MDQDIYKYVRQLGDNSMIIGHRLSELCGHGPTLETDIALTNISLDLFGQVRLYFQYAAKLSSDEKTEDDIAFLRYSHEYNNCLLVEQPNTDFAHVIVRQFLYDSYHHLLLQALVYSTNKQIAAIATKTIKEVKYHLRFSSNWLVRLGDGTKESSIKTQQAINQLQPYVEELFQPSEVESRLMEQGIAADLKELKPIWYKLVNTTFDKAGLILPESEYHLNGGKSGKHSECFGYILSDLQYMQRAYPNMIW